MEVCVCLGRFPPFWTRMYRPVGAKVEKIGVGTSVERKVKRNQRAPLTESDWERNGTGTDRPIKPIQLGFWEIETDRKGIRKEKKAFYRVLCVRTGCPA